MQKTNFNVEILLLLKYYINFAIELKTKVTWIVIL